VGVGVGVVVGLAVPAVPPSVVSSWTKPTKAASRINRGQRMATLRLSRSLGQGKYFVKRLIVLGHFRRGVFCCRSVST